METDNQRTIETTRGQTAYDFAIGVSVFLVVLVGLLAFVPSVFGGTDGPGQGQDPLSADRVAGSLVDDGFASPDTPSVLETHCVLAFFDDAAGCGFGAGNPLTEDLALAPGRPVNVTVEADVDDDGTRERLCWDDGSNSVTHVGDSDCSGAGDVPFTAGSNAALNEQYAEASRAGVLGSERVFVVVRTW